MRSITKLDLQYAHRFYGFKGEAQYLHGHTGELTIEVEDSVEPGVNMVFPCNEIQKTAWAVLKNFSPLFVTDQWEPETLKGKKVTIVFSDEKLMNAVQEKLSVACFNNSFSLMLVDLHKVVIVKEVPLPTNGSVKYESILDVKRKELDTVKGKWMQLGAVAFPDTALE